MFAAEIVGRPCEPFCMSSVGDVEGGGAEEEGRVDVDEIDVFDFVKNFYKSNFQSPPLSHKFESLSATRRLQAPKWPQTSSTPPPLLSSL